MKLIVGLGNPGEKYINTRHNVGFMVVDKLAEKLSLTSFVDKKLEAEVFDYRQQNVILAKPLTYMNNSGLSVKKLVIRYKLKMTDLWVIHDDLDLRLGTYKIQKGVGPKLHYGIQSIEQELGRNDFWRIRIGVDNRPKETRVFGENYVLEKFSIAEFSQLNEKIEKALFGLKDVLDMKE